MNAPWNPGTPCFGGCLLLDGRKNDSQDGHWKPGRAGDTAFVPHPGLPVEDVAEVHYQ